MDHCVAMPLSLNPPVFIVRSHYCTYGDKVTNFLPYFILQKTLKVVPKERVPSSGSEHKILFFIFPPVTSKQLERQGSFTKPLPLISV